MHRVLSALFFLAFLASTYASAATYERGVLVRQALIYVSPDAKSAKLGEIERGQEVIALESSREWLHVTAALGPEKTITGWILGKGVIRDRKSVV